MFQRTIVQLCKHHSHQQIIQANRRNMAQQVGFIGLGLMGTQMANHMARKGTKLKVFDVDSNAANSVKGAQVCSTAAEAAQDVDVVFTMLPDGNIVKDTVMSESGIAKGIKSGALHVDCSTIAPKHAQELYEFAKCQGYNFIDSPVSGGVNGAVAGTLTYMIGGDQANVDVASPYLLQAGKKIFYCGSSGLGQIAKLCNNLILGCTMIATAESFNMAIKAGLDPKIFSDIVNVSTGRSWTSEVYNPVPGIMQSPASKNYDGGFQVKLIAKDLGLAEGAAIEYNSPVPMTAQAHQWYRTLMSHGMASKDFSIVYKFLNGIPAK